MLKGHRYSPISVLWKSKGRLDKRTFHTMHEGNNPGWDPESDNHMTKLVKHLHWPMDNRSTTHHLRREGSQQEVLCKSLDLIFWDDGQSMCWKGNTSACDCIKADHNVITSLRMSLDAGAISPTTLVYLMLAALILLYS